MVWWIVIGALWLACGVLNFGLMFAHFQREFKLIANEQQSSDFLFCLLGSLLGPVALFSTITTGTCCHGFKYNLKPEGIAWEQFKENGYR